MSEHEATQRIIARLRASGILEAMAITRERREIVEEFKANPHLMADEIWQLRQQVRRLSAAPNT